MKPKQDKSGEIIIKPIKMVTAHVCVIGKQPLIMNRMAEKARQELLLPARRKNSADKRTRLKHDPIEEFRSSIYKSSSKTALSAIHLPSGSFSKSMAQAALDIPGATKAQIQRWVRVKDLGVSIFGVPELYMAVVRTMGINKTPDIRTRAIFPKWVAFLDVEFVLDFISQNTITTLLEAAGFLSGVGDHRAEKGGDFGQFRIADKNDPELLDIVNNGGREAQIEAMANPKTYDAETAELFGWFQNEMAVR